MPPGGRLEDLALFASVATHASFAAASRKEKVPPSTMSRAVARLEEAVGVRLLQRTTRKVSLTEEGRDLFLRAGPHLEALDEALRSTSDRREEPRGSIRVTAPAYTGATRVAAALADFAHAHPGVTIELDPTNTLRDLVDEGYDFAIRVGPVAEGDFVARRLWTGRFELYASPAFVRGHLRGKAIATERTLAELPCVVTRAAATWRFRAKNGSKIEIAPHVRFAVNDPRAAVEAARKGLGLVLAPRDAAEAPGAPKLVRLAIDFGEPEPVPLFVVYPSRRLLPARVRLAIEWLMQPRYALDATRA